MRAVKSLLIVIALTHPLFASAQTVQSRVASVSNGRTSFRCRVVTIRLGGPVQARIVIAQGGVGRTESFESMVARTHAVAAVNGSFFDAYNKTGDKDPNMTLITGGEVIHKGGTGTVIGFGPQGPIMGRLELPIRGVLAAPGQRPSSWFAYWLNRTPQSAENICIYTPARGGRCRVFDGASVVVRQGIVQQVVEGDTAIPHDGFVINFRGPMAGEARRFTPGALVSYTLPRNPRDPASPWEHVTEAVGAGPRLLTDGVITLTPTDEGFTEAKILTARGLRSVIGITSRGDILLVSVGGATMLDLAQIMRSLGAVQAMNLDGGASAGLFANGSMLTRPGRALSNALVFTRR